MNFDTVDILSITTARLFGTVTGLKSVLSFLANREIETNEIGKLSVKARKVILLANIKKFPKERKPLRTNDDFLNLRDKYILELGETTNLPTDLKGTL